MVDWEKLYAICRFCKNSVLIGQAVYYEDGQFAHQSCHELDMIDSEKAGVDQLKLGVK